MRTPPELSHRAAFARFRISSNPHPESPADNVFNDFKGWNSISNRVVIPGDRRETRDPEPRRQPVFLDPGSARLKPLVRDDGVLFLLKFKPLKTGTSLSARL
jgi:hypothetical protein